MKTIAAASLVVLLFVSTTESSIAQKVGSVAGMITEEEKEKALKLLKDSRDELLASIEGLTEEQWKYSPGLGRWSIAEVVEHIALSEVRIFGAVTSALSRPANPDWETGTAGKDAFLERALLNRSFRAEAPEAIRPQRGMPGREFIQKFKASRAATIEFLLSNDRPLKAHTQDHPFPVFGTLNAYQWLIYVPLHNQRHNLQIKEVLESAGFPR